MSGIDALRGIPLFAGLSEQQIARVSSVVRRVRVADATAVLREGDSGDSLYILASGSVQVTKRLGMPGSARNDGKEKALVQLTAPQFFGEMGILEEAERSATVTTIGECELLEMRRADFERLSSTDHQLGYLVVRNIARVLSARLRNTDRDVLKLTIALSLALGNR